MEKKSIIAFNNYIVNFDLNNQKINDKYHHSISVMNLSYDLAQHLKLKKSDCNIARIIDLIHGYGRFDQLTKYDSYDDFENIDHGDYGVQLLFAENLIKNYKVNPKKNFKMYERLENNEKYKYYYDNISKYLYEKVTKC